jgi:hypothetical protein
MGKKNTRIGVVMKMINFRYDVDQVLQDAQARQKAVLLDFNAAPM